MIEIGKIQLSGRFICGLFGVQLPVFLGGDEIESPLILKGRKRIQICFCRLLLNQFPQRWARFGGWPPEQHVAIGQLHGPEEGALHFCFCFDVADPGGQLASGGQRKTRDN